jgi:Flp pilus assembly protein TadG
MMKLLKEESGQTLVVVTIFMSLVAVGFLALALDTGYLFRERRMVQSAADAAAVAAAEEVATGNSSNKQAVANAMAKLNGFDTTLAKNPAVVTFPTPTGVFSGSNYVAVTVSKPIPTFFLAAFSPKLATETVSATATAGGGQLSQTCVCLDGGSGQTLSLSNGTKLTANGCGIVDNSSDNNGIGVNGGSSLTATSVGLVSTSWVQSSNVGGGSTWSAPVVTGTNKCSPALPPPPAYSNCVADPGGSWGTFSWGPATAGGTVCYSSLTVGANGSTCTLKPGIYVITGTLHFQSGAGGHSNLGGNGVFFYLTGTANLVIDNGANVNLVAGGGTELGGGTAQSLGAGYDGIAIYQATGDVSPISIQGGSNSYIGGALYAPSAQVSVGNGSAMTFPIGGLLASSLSMTGGSVLNVISDANEGSITFGSPKLVQ